MNPPGAAGTDRLPVRRCGAFQDGSVAGYGEIFQVCEESRLRGGKDSRREQQVFQYPAEVVLTGILRIREKLLRKFLRFRPARAGLVRGGFFLPLSPRAGFSDAGL